MSYRSDLEDEHIRLQKLKLNIHLENLQRFACEVKKQWVPRTKEVEGQFYHGSSQGMDLKILLYWDELRAVWTTKELAFQGHLLVVIQELLNKNKVEKFKV